MTDAYSLARDRLVARMELCPVSAARARQLRGGAMPTAAEDCALQAISDALDERTDSPRPTNHE